MADQFTEIRRVSYFDNIKKSFGGMIFGFILFLASFVLLWWNEGNRVSLSQKEDLISEKTIVLSSPIINRENDNALVMISGPVYSNETLSDPMISVNNALNLKRDVEMYQWVEKKNTKKHNSFGGSTTEITNYSYQKMWDKEEHNSDNFHMAEYQNPKFTIRSKLISSNTAIMGDFIIRQHQISKIENYRQIDKLTENKNYSIVDNYYYKGKDASAPEIGDIRISYTYVPSGVSVSIIGQQNQDNSITISKNEQIYLQYDGDYSLDEMLNKYKTENQLLTFGLRFVGWLIMFIGLLLLVNPIVTISKFIPFLSSIIGFISSFFLLILSLVLSLVTIAVAWLTYRPIIAIILFAFIFGILYYFRKYLRKKKATL